MRLMMISFDDTVEEKHSDFGFDYYATRAALFRYSAATFNAHRIHLDPEYCRNEEGHPGTYDIPREDHTFCRIFS